MANYSFVRVPLKISSAQVKEAIDAYLREWLPQWEIKVPSWGPEEAGAERWHVFLPNTAIADERAATEAVLAPGDDVGFSIEYVATRHRLKFRHSPNQFENWAQGVIAESLGEHFKTGVLYDATGQTFAGSHREYRRGRTFFEYAVRNFDKPLSEEDRAFVDKRFRFYAPEGHWR